MTISGIQLWQRRKFGQICEPRKIPKVRECGDIELRQVIPRVGRVSACCVVGRVAEVVVVHDTFLPRCAPGGARGLPLGAHHEGAGQRGHALASAISLMVAQASGSRAAIRGRFPTT